MKKWIFVFILFPFFANAQEALNTSNEQPGLYQQDSGQSEVSDQELMMFRRWRRMPRCGPHSDYKCTNRRVYDSCEKDNSHGYYGRCDNYAQRGPGVVCNCR